MAELALVRPVPRVQSHMRLHVALLCECLEAELALVWTLSCVGAVVALQRLLVDGRVAAEAAVEAPCPRKGLLRFATWKDQPHTKGTLFSPTWALQHTYKRQHYGKLQVNSCADIGSSPILHSLLKVRFVGTGISGERGVQLSSNKTKISYNYAPKTRLSLPDAKVASQTKHAIFPSSLSTKQSSQLSEV